MGPAFSAFDAYEQLARDLRTYLPCPSVFEYARGQIIYDHNKPLHCIFLVVDGMVKAFVTTNQGLHIALDIYQKGSVFGESALLGTRFGRGTGS